MPTILRQDGFEVMVLTNDHRPAHVHIFKAEGEVVIHLGSKMTPPRVRVNIGMSRADERRALVIVGEHQVELLREWSSVFMAKVKIGAWEIDEEELEQQHQEARRRGERQATAEPQGTMGELRPADGSACCRVEQWCHLLEVVEVFPPGVSRRSAGGPGAGFVGAGVAPCSTGKNSG